MTRRILVLALCAAALGACSWQAKPAATAQQAKKRVLILAETNGFHHSSIPTTVQTVWDLGAQHGWDVVAVAADKDSVSSSITADRLKNIDLVVFANTTGNLDFTPEGHQAFYDWIKNGGAYVGIHSASDTFHGDPDYLELVRGEFLTHGPQVTVTAYVQDPDHPACKDLPASFDIHDEIYQFKNWSREKCHVLLSMHNHPDPSKKGQTGDFPIAWTNRDGKGRMFYTSLGHREDVYQNPIYLKHLTGGILWALGMAEGSDAPGNPMK